MSSYRAVLRSIHEMPIRLLDGPLAPLSDSATGELVKLMAAVLIEFDAFHNERDSIRALMGKFPMVEIVVHGDNARQYAMQTIVAKEMAKP